jgi:hypothetical protein
MFDFDSEKPLEQNPFTADSASEKKDQLLSVRVTVLDITGPRAKRFPFLAFLAGRVLAWLEDLVFLSRPPTVLLQGRVELNGKTVMLFQPSQIHKDDGFGTMLLISHDASTSIAPQPATTPGSN